MMDQQALILVDQIEPLIREVRRQKVIPDKDLAELYGVPTKRLNEQVRRNRGRFPEDFVFQLTEAETGALRSQNATAATEKSGMRSQNATASKRNVRYRPYAFTEHGAIMAATILNSPRAVEVSVFVVRAFVKLRQLALTHKELAAKLNDLERKVAGHDGALRQLVATIRQLMEPPPDEKPKRRFGFARDREDPPP
jgi:hypothetical protein